MKRSINEYWEAKPADIHYKCTAFPQIHQNTTKVVLDSYVLTSLILFGRLPFSHFLSSKSQHSNLLLPIPVTPPAFQLLGLGIHSIHVDALLVSLAPPYKPRLLCVAFCWHWGPPWIHLPNSYDKDVQHSWAFLIISCFILLLISALLPLLRLLPNWIWSECLRGNLVFPWVFPHHPAQALRGAETQLKLLLTEGAPGSMEASWGRILCSRHGTLGKPRSWQLPSGVPCRNMGPWHVKRCDRESWTNAASYKVSIFFSIWGFSALIG